MNSLAIRLTSAVVALLVLVGTYYFFATAGLHFCVLIAVLLGARELTNILFQKSDPAMTKIAFYLGALLIFVLSCRFFPFALLIYGCIAVVFCSIHLWCHRSSKELPSLFSFQARSLLGFFYVGILPVFADRVVSLRHGDIWFLTLLGVVFAGDTMAYIFGMTWGKNKVMPVISPKKTLEGSAGGLLGSLIGALVANVFLPHIPLFAMCAMGLVAGAMGQFGDFFESLLKRVADVKDSGSLMPGHGGVLDRIDGVIFAAPFVYLTALLFETAVLSH
jgi:phosphatidate cytidylyltransferase